MQSFFCGPIDSTPKLKKDVTGSGIKIDEKDGLTQILRPFPKSFIFHLECFASSK